MKTITVSFVCWTQVEGQLIENAIEINARMA